MSFVALFRLHVALFLALVLGVQGLVSAPAKSAGATCPLRSLRNSLRFDAPTVFLPTTRNQRGQLVASYAFTGSGAGSLVPVLPCGASKRGGGGFLRRAGELLRLQATSLEGEVVGPAPDKGGKKKKKKKKQRAPGSTKPLEVHVVGLSHHNAEVEVREKLAVPEDQWNEASKAICEFGNQNIKEAAVLSTCNRFEVYVASSDARAAMYDATKYLSERSGIPMSKLRESLFMLSGEEAVWHLLRVAGGLDSLVVGEGQILAQVKACFERGTELPVEADEDREAVVGGSAGKVVSKLLNTAVASGKRVRSETAISRGAVSISSAAAEFSASRAEADVGKSLKDASILIIGAGKMTKLLLTHLNSAGISKAILLNRSRPRMEALAAEYPDMEIQMGLMDECWDRVRQSDIVFTSTSSEEAFVTKEVLEQEKVGQERPIMFVDISVPRNVDRDTNDLEGVASYNVDDLKAVVARNTAMRQREVLEAEILLAEEKAKYRGWQESLGAVPAINALQKKAEDFRAAELQKVAGKLDKLSSKERDAVERLSRGIVNKLLHGPMTSVRANENPEDKKRTLNTLNKMFGL